PQENPVWRPRSGAALESWAGPGWEGWDPVPVKRRDKGAPLPPRGTGGACPPPPRYGIRPPPNPGERHALRHATAPILLWYRPARQDDARLRPGPRRHRRLRPQPAGPP